MLSWNQLCSKEYRVLLVVIPKNSQFYFDFGRAAIPSNRRSAHDIRSRSALGTKQTEKFPPVNLMMIYPDEIK